MRLLGGGPEGNGVCYKTLGHQSVRQDGRSLHAGGQSPDYLRLQTQAVRRCLPGAAKEFDRQVEGVLSALRNRGEFVGELGETILFIPPKGSIPAKRVLVIGLGDEQKLSLDTLGIAGRVAARESVRLKAGRVAWAPVIRDQGNSALDVGEADGAFVEQMLLAYGTEKSLQAQGLADEFSIEEWVIEAGETYFDGAVKHVGEALESSAREIARRGSTPYTSQKGGRS